MEGYGTSSYGDGFADVYDDWYHGITDTDACVARLAALAPAGARVLEFGVGTGRLAIPLRPGASPWSGSMPRPAMLDRLAAKPGGDQVQVVVGDMAELAEARPPITPDDHGSSWSSWPTTPCSTWPMPTPSAGW